MSCSAIELKNDIIKTLKTDFGYDAEKATIRQVYGAVLTVVQQKLLDKLVRDNRAARRQADENNGEYLEMRADEYVKSLYGSVDMKGASEEVKKVRADFIAAQTMELVDPINIDAEMKRLEETISGFTVEIDAALSVSNALTEITVEY